MLHFRTNQVKFALLAALICLLGTGCSVLIKEMMPIDPQSATLTALVTPTSIRPTLDKKGNDVIEEQGCIVYRAPSITTFEDAIDGGTFQWAEHPTDEGDLLAYVTPENRYWAWFSGDAAVVTLPIDPDGELTVKFTSSLNVFGDFAFSPNGTRVAFTVFRPSDKLYTVYIASLASSLQLTTDLFPGNVASTDEYSSQKSVIGWVSENELRVSTSCGIDCERVYRINTNNASMVLEEETRKYGHPGREFNPIVRTLDVRYYPEMDYSNWSLSGNLVFYVDERDDAWIMNETTKRQYLVDLPGRNLLQTAWSPDDRFIALRYAEEIIVYRTDCRN